MSAHLRTAAEDLHEIRQGLWWIEHVDEVDYDAGKGETLITMRSGRVFRASFEEVTDEASPLPEPETLPAVAPLPNVDSSPVIDLRGDEPDPLAIAVFTCLGAASVCWESLDGTGEFQSTRAKEIGEELLAFIQKRYVRRETEPAELPAANAPAFTDPPL